MTRKKLLHSLIILMLFIFGLDFLGRTFFWYFSLWYFDLITHFLGGFWVGMFFIYMYLRLGGQANIPRVLLSVLFIGVIWEIFEYIVFNRIGLVPFDPFDTGLDLIVDVLGGTGAVLYVYRKIFPQKVSAI